MGDLPPTHLLQVPVRKSFLIDLPFAIATVVLLVLTAFAWMAYSEIRDSALAAAAEHLDRGAHQLAAVLQAGIPSKNDAIKAGLDLLADLDWIEAQEAETGGRPSVKYAINPWALR